MSKPSVFLASLIGIATLVMAAKADTTQVLPTEDPLLGVVRALKCVNCVPDSVVFLVDDPIDGQVIEVKIPSREYNKVLTSLQGKRLFTKPDSGCFYWRERVKTAPSDTTLKTSSAKPNPAQPNSSKPVFKPSLCLPYSAEFKGIH